MINCSEIESDILVIGAGIAGCCAALEAAYTGKQVILISKVPPLHAHSVSARGGINVSVNEQNAAAHINDTLEAGGGIGNLNAIKMMCADAPKNLLWLEKLGVHFSKNENGSFQNKAFGCSKVARACFSKDRTGLAIMITLIKQIKKTRNIVLLDQMMAVKLLSHKRQFFGAQVLNLRDSTFCKVTSKAVILATGGGLNVYQQNTNAISTTGDGLGLAVDAGAALRDMEFVQFHPLGLRATGIQIPEPVLAAGGRILDSKGERLLKHSHPEKMELAGRDKVSIAIAKELKKDPKSEFFLDLSHVPKEKEYAIKEAQKIAETFLNVDIKINKVSIAPSAHYLMGGVSCNIYGQALDHQGNTLHGLYVAGEAACNGVHGANRVGGNSLLEVVVFGRKAGTNAAKLMSSRSLHTGSEAMLKIPYGENKIDIGAITKRLKLSMSENAAAIRSENSLDIQLAIIQQLKADFNEYKVNDFSRYYNQQIKQYFELKSLLTVSSAICLAAKQRQESRGAHYRTDFSKLGDYTDINSMVYRGSNGLLKSTLVKRETFNE